MAKFSRGGQLSDPGRKAQTEQRRLRLSQKVKAERRQKFLGMAKKGLLISMALLGIVFIASQQTISFDSSDLSQEYADTANDYLAENPLGRFKFTFSEEEFSNYIINNNPEVGAVSVNMPIFGQASLTISERSPVFYWSTDQGTLLGDETGVVYRSADNQSELQIPTLKDNSPLSANKGDKVVSSSTLEYIEALSQEFESKAVTVAHYQIPSSSREVYVFPRDKKYYIKISQDRSVVGQVDEASKTMKFLDKSNKQPKEYIDVRVIDKAYYR